MRSDAADNLGWTRERIVHLGTMVGEAKVLLAPAPALVSLEDELLKAQYAEEGLMRFVQALVADSAVLDALAAALDRWPEKDHDRLSDAVGLLKERINSQEKQI